MTIHDLRRLVEECIRCELLPGASLSGFDEDVVDSGTVDSMAWIGVVREVERRTGILDLGEHLIDGPRSAASIVQAIQAAGFHAATAGGSSENEIKGRQDTEPKPASVIAGWSATSGKKAVPIAEVERAFKLPKGKLARGAGMESVAHATATETEAVLGAAACKEALQNAGIPLADVHLLIATSETCAGFPQLGAQVHARLHAAGGMGVLDVGGACMGLVNAFITAKALLESGQARCILVVTADVHSRILTPQQVKGEFGGLFGDGASAFVLQAASAAKARKHYRLGEWMSGGSGAYARAIRVGLGEAGKLTWAFEGEALARAAVERLEHILAELESRARAHRKDAAAFATHQPNPRLVALLAKQLGVPLEKFPPVARHYGNLGSSTCGTALALALAEHAGKESGPIFLASLAPGLLWSGMVLHAER